MGQRVESVSVTYLCDSHISVLEVIQDAFPFFLQYPFVYRDSVHVFEESAEGRGCVTSQMCKFFHTFHLAVILYHEVLEALRISTDRVEESL